MHFMMKCRTFRTHELSDCKSHSKRLYCSFHNEESHQVSQSLVIINDATSVVQPLIKELGEEVSHRFIRDE